MNSTRWIRSAVGAGILAAAVALVVGIAGCEKKASDQSAQSGSGASTNTGSAGNKTASKSNDAAGAKAATSKASKYVVGVIAKSTENPVFLAAKTGAEDAAKDLSIKYGVAIEARWLTPVNEDAAKQAENIEQLVAQSVDGICISCTDGKVLKKPIDDAVSRGVVVVTFDSDSPESNRMAYYGIDDVEAGRAVMRELAEAMGTGGPVAILGGNQTAPNLQARIRGVREELDKLKDRGFTLKKEFYHAENANDAKAMLEQSQTANPDIAGWAMVGGWPLFTQGALDKIADKAKVVSVDTLPAQLGYVKNGQCYALIGQDCYGWGYESVRMVIEKVIEGKTPKDKINHFNLKVVKKDNVSEVEGLWDKWLKKK